MPRILIADDEWVTRVEIEEMLTDLGYEVVGQAETGAEAIDMVRSLEPDLIVMDVMMPGEMNGIDAARVIKAELGTPIIFITGYGDPEYIEAAKEIAPFGYVMKPFDEKEIHASVEIALSKRELELKLMQAHEGLERANLILQEEIASRKKTERELRESEKLYRDIFEKNKAIKWVLDPSTGKIIDANSAACEFYQYSYEEMTNLYLWDINLMGETEMKKFLASAASEEQTEFTFKHRKASGEICTVQIYTGTLETGGKKLLHSIIIDITDRIRADEALRESHKRLDFALQGGELGMWDWNPQDGAVVYNDLWAQMLEYRPDEVEPTVDFFKQHVHPEDLSAVLDRLNGHVEGRLPVYESEHRLCTKSGNYFWVLDRGRIVERDKDGRPVRVTGIIADITKRKQAEEALRKSEERFRNLYDDAPVGYFEYDLRGNITRVNRTELKILGYSAEEMIGQPCWKFIVDEAAREQILAKLAGTRPPAVGLERTYRRKDGTTFPVLFKDRLLTDENGHITGIRTAIQDITERKRLEFQLQQSLRMEAIGTLTGGIAHDYNNLMSIVMGNLSLAIEEAEPGSFLADFLDEANTASHKVRNLTHELMSLSRGGAPVKELGSLDELLKTALDMMPADRGISLNESVSQDLWHVLHDPYKIGAVFRNVVTNAVEAMPEGGTLNITAENLRIDDKGQYPGLPLNPGNYVHISFQDQGVGIPEEQLDKIFDPYFSTKEMGVQKGMGLGLATAYALVKSHGGHVAVDSTVGVGTTVNIYLPAEKHVNQADDITTSADNTASPVKRVLVMDDEEMLRNLAEKMLEKLGYAVETAKDGMEAIEFYKKQKDLGQPFDAVILDLTIKGGMGGEQTIQELLKINPDVKAIVCSGYFNDPVMSNFEKYGFMGALAKPYEKKALKKTLERLSE